MEWKAKKEGLPAKKFKLKASYPIVRRSLFTTSHTRLTYVALLFIYYFLFYPTLSYCFLNSLSPSLHLFITPSLSFQRSLLPSLSPSLPPSFLPPSLFPFLLPPLSFPSFLPISLPHSLPPSLTFSPSLSRSLPLSLPHSLPPSLPLSLPFSLPPSPSLPPSQVLIQNNYSDCGVFLLQCVETLFEFSEKRKRRRRKRRRS